MSRGELLQIHPVIPVKSVTASLHFYVEKLGFTIAFTDNNTAPTYAGVRRDHIEIHLQSHSAKEWEAMTASSLRFVVTQIEDLYSEYKKASVFHSNTALRETTWGTKEFAFFDPDMNGLSFYRDIKIIT